MTKLMGIVNLTPDSFSGDGLYHANIGELQAKLEQAIAAGADILDIGAESTRPGAMALSAKEEWARITPVLPFVAAGRIRYSLDSYHPENACRAIAAGFAWINDVTGGRDTDLIKAVANSEAHIVLMHSLCVPVDKAITLPQNADPVAEVLAWGREALARCAAVGIARDRIILDPGIGFGKTAVQSFSLIKQVAAFKAWGVRLLIGHSRKSFLAGFGEDRDAATLAVSYYLATQKVDYLRVHDIPAHRALLNVTEALR